MTSDFAQVVVDVAATAGVFDYAIPDALREGVTPGQLALVPFGNRTVQGIVWRLLERSSVPNVRQISAIIDEAPVLTAAQMAISESLAEETLSPLAAIVGLFVPAGLAQHADRQYELADAGPAASTLSSHAPSDGLQSRLLKLLRARGPLRGRQIDRHFGPVQWRRSMRVLVRNGVVQDASVLPPARVRPKFVRTAELAAAPEHALRSPKSLGGTEASRRRREAALRVLLKHPEPLNVAWLYAESGCKFDDLRELAERDLVVLHEVEVFRDPVARLPQVEMPSAGRLVLTSEQAAAWQAILDGYRQLQLGKPAKPLLLEGVTGSGKTELYLRAAEETVRASRQAFILVPEIALTPQTVQRFVRRFPGETGLLHSRLSDGERYDTWRRIRAGKIKVVVGPRSALFAPLPSVGLIVLDECHDQSYYQAEPPFYDAVALAQIYARTTGALVILGSATPTVAQRHASETGGFHRVTLASRIGASLSAEDERGLPPVSTVDMREELKSGNRAIFSRELAQELEAALRRREQAILFVNRRGTATYVFCRDCGTGVRCPRCETPLTMHTSEREELTCHHCGYARAMPRTCSRCGSGQIGAYGLGSERVETEVRRLLPRARVLRWDRDTTRLKGEQEIILAHFAAGRADVLVGTQMLAKGLHLPMVTLVGIVLAEVGLHLPDPFASERVFQVLTHVSGRAGRGERPGRVVLQTYSPTHYAIRAAAAHDFEGFYQMERSERQRLEYPPFTRLVRLEYRHHDAAAAEAEARSLGEDLKRRLSGANAEAASAMIGPVPCFYRRLGGQWRWQIVLRDKDPRPQVPVPPPAGWRIEVDPPSLL